MSLKNINAATRLITTLQYLNKGLIINVEELSEEFGISKRQIQNDIKLFSTLFDIESLGQQNYKLKKAYQLIGVDEELTQIALALLKSLQHNALPQMDSLMDNIIPKSEKYNKMFHFQLDYESINNIQIFYDILKATTTHKSTHYTYTKKDSSKKEVYAHPYKIANFSNYWYLLAYDVENSLLKSYHINSISNLTIDDENFISDTKVENEIDLLCNKADSPWFSGESKNVTLRIEGEARYYIERNLPHNLKLLEKKEESNLYTFTYYDEDELFIFMKQWIPDIRISDNKNLQDKFLQILNKYINKQ